VPEYPAIGETTYLEGLKDRSSYLADKAVMEQKPKANAVKICLELKEQTCWIGTNWVKMRPVAAWWEYDIDITCRW
jgi:hypothetical protein